MVRKVEVQEMIDEIEEAVISAELTIDDAIYSVPAGDDVKTNSVASLRKVSKRNLKKSYSEVEEAKLSRANEFLTDLLISKWADLLGGLNAIESSESLIKELERDKLLKGM